MSAADRWGLEPKPVERTRVHRERIVENMPHPLDPSRIIIVGEMPGHSTFIRDHEGHVHVGILHYYEGDAATMALMTPEEARKIGNSLIHLAVAVEADAAKQASAAIVRAGKRAK